MLFFFLLTFFISSTNANYDLKCPPDATLFHDNKTCYLVVKDSKSFADAEDACNKQGGNLAMVRNQFENMFISTLVYETVENFKYYWIGGTMRTVMMNGGKSVDVWSWTKDNALIIFSDWDPSASSTGNCTGVEGNSFWSAIDCKTKSPFVCEIPAAVDYNCEFCDNGWAYYSLTYSCYKKFSVTRAIYQSTAENSCIQKGGHLASIHSDEENQFIGQLTSIGYKTSYYASIFWIGGKRNSNLDSWRWVDNTSFHYVNWGANYDYANRFCVSYWPDSTSDYKNSPMVWNADSCQNQLYSHLCKKPSYLQQKNFSTNANSDMKCPPGATLFYDNKTCYLVVKGAKSFADAEDVCNKQGGNLAMVQSQPENMFIISLVYEAIGNFKYYWIGGILRTVMMNGKKSVDVWSWTRENALMIYSYWNSSSPATGNCTGIETNGFWFGIDCKMSNPFVCEFPAKIDYNCEFCDDGWTHFSLTHSCYKKFSVTEAINHSTADNLCVQKGGHLASIHSDEENQFIGDLTSIGYKTSSAASTFFIGGKRDDNSDNWRWTDKTPFDYANWGINFNYTNYFCAEYWPDSTSDYANIPMVWNAKFCDGTKNSYLCKKQSYKS